MAPIQTSAIIKVDGLEKYYGHADNQVKVLHGVDLSFTTGSFTAIMGPSGSGKTTLLQCMAGLDTPSAGTVTIADTDLTKLREKQRSIFRRDKIGFIFQDYNLLPYLTVLENVALPQQLAKKHPKKADLLRALEQVGIADHAKKFPDQLSGGQQQRVAIARTLASQPQVLFADEPTGALDRNTSKVTLRLLRGLADTASQTIIMVTHDPLAASYASRVIFLLDGRIIHQLHDPTVSAVTNVLAKMEG